MEASCVGIAEQVFDREFNKRVNKENPEFKQIIRDISYPVGYYYYSVLNENPEKILGGYWAACHAPNGLYGWLRTANRPATPNSELPSTNAVRVFKLPYSYQGPSGTIFYYVADAEENIAVSISNPRSTMDCSCFYIAINGKVSDTHKNGEEYFNENPNGPYGPDKKGPYGPEGPYGPHGPDDYYGPNEPYETHRFYGTGSLDRYYHLSAGDVLAIEYDDNTRNGFNNAGDNSNSSYARIDINNR